MKHKKNLLMIILLLGTTACTPARQGQPEARPEAFNLTIKGQTNEVDVCEYSVYKSYYEDIKVGMTLKEVESIVKCEAQRYSAEDLKNTTITNWIFPNANKSFIGVSTVGKSVQKENEVVYKVFQRGWDLDSIRWKGEQIEKLPQ